jgi:hypothetical protein
MGIIMHNVEHRMRHVQAINIRGAHNLFRRTGQVCHVFLNIYFSKQAVTWKSFWSLLPQVLVCKTGDM